MDKTKMEILVDRVVDQIDPPAHLKLIAGVFVRNAIESLTVDDFRFLLEKEKTWQIVPRLFVEQYVSNSSRKSTRPLRKIWEGIAKVRKYQNNQQ